MKEKRSVTNHNLVEVTFDDPAEFDATRQDSCEPAECKAIGWLEEKNSSIVRLTWLREENDEPYTGIIIPRGCVKKLQSIGVHKTNKSKRRRY